MQTGCSVCASCWLPATPAEATKHGELLATGTAGKSEGLSRRGHRMKASSWNLLHVFVGGDGDCLRSGGAPLSDRWQFVDKMLKSELGLHRWPHTPGALHATEPDRLWRSHSHFCWMKQKCVFWLPSSVVLFCGTVQEVGLFIVSVFHRKLFQPYFEYMGTFHRFIFAVRINKSSTCCTADKE